MHREVLTLGIWSLKCRISRDQPVLENHDSFHQPRQTCGGLTMSNITFYLCGNVSELWRCELVLFHTDPMRSGRSMARDEAKTDAMPVASTGSPAAVPVPWHSKYAVSE